MSENDELLLDRAVELRKTLERTIAELRLRERHRAPRRPQRLRLQAARALHENALVQVRLAIAQLQAAEG